MQRKFCLVACIVFAMVQVAEAGQLKIILRYDDYSRSSNADVEQALFDAARNVGGGVLVGVIPFPEAPYPIPGPDGVHLIADLGKQKVDMLKKYALEGTIEIAVHGFSHRNNAARGPNSEFAGLPESTQALLLSSAKTSLEETIGLSVKSFVPPFNQYDNQTLKALESSGYKLLSAGSGGPALPKGRISYLPGGPYPYRLKDVVLSALSNGHTDALVIATIHPYDIVEAGEMLPDFRRSSPQVSIQKLKDDLQQIKELGNVRFMRVGELFENSEDLSPDRLQINQKLRGSFVTRHRLLPETFGVYPLTGLYYSQNNANRMYLIQASAFALQYGMLILVVILITKAVLRRIHNRIRNITALAGTISVAGIIALLAKSLSSGFYMTSAIGVTCCLGILAGIALNRWRTQPLHI